MNQKRINLVQTADGHNYLWPYVLVTSLFFLWGFAHSILDVLNKHFQDTLGVSKTESALVQAVVYGGYFLMALPAGQIIRRLGYRGGVLTGLLLYGIGALLFIPGGQLNSFPFFLFSLFVIGCGLTCLETAANPYVTVLGNQHDAERRINLSQSFNGLGWIVGPIVGGQFLFAQQANHASISVPYAIIGIIVLFVAAIFVRAKLPEVEATSNISSKESTQQGIKECTTKDNTQTATHTKVVPRGLWTHRNFVVGMVALFLYVAAQTGINSFFINYVTEFSNMNRASAANLLGFGAMALFMVGRMGGSWVMAIVQSERVLLCCALGAIIAMAILLTGAGSMGIAAFLLCYLCESIMFPTIFALALRGVGEHTKQASSYLIMCIVGGAVAPLLMGLIADYSNMAQAFIVPLVCFVGIGLYALMLLKPSAHAQR